ncbi:uncharacterized protein LOC117104681 [Anneissia japonica]|uniref:uncharacterized protein LOC117104681 n=1 Tax=Anneissia japonica TaxID=1529436 RepID=UPI0014254E33|nr:uncharacterized protein LOC117104681 [Anneissia japonica]
MSDSPSAPSMGVPESGSAKKVKLLDPVGEENENVPSTPLSRESEPKERKPAMSPTKVDANKFDMLCDGVLNSITLVQSALADFLALKDEMLLHTIPPTLMAQLAIVSGKLYRSTTDMYTPVTELVRLVRVYSVPWEEKSAALKKLHTDYESKHKQLNIAIRRLQLLDMQSQRIAREKRIMNWEKLFSKLTSCKGHGRRWKFLIDTFKQKAKLGEASTEKRVKIVEPDKLGRTKSMIGSKARSSMGRKKKDVAEDEAWKDESFHHLVFKLDEEPRLEKPSLDSVSEKNDEEAESTNVNEDTTETGDAPRERKRSRVEDQLRLAVLTGSFEEMNAMATIDAADLQTLEVELKESVADTTDQVPANFPVYPIKTSAKNKDHLPCGTVRLAFFYTRVHKPFTLDKQTGSKSINEIVMDLTDIDLRVTRKEDLPWNKEYRDRCLSALSLRSSESDKPEMVTRAEFDMLIEQHNQEIEVMQEDFETRIKSLAESIAKLQNDQLNALMNPQLQAGDGRFGSPLHGWTTEDRKMLGSKNQKLSQSKQKRQPKNLPKWGSDLPKDFFERLKLFNEESIRHQQELADRVKEEVRCVIEQQLAGQYKLSTPATQASDLEKDVCLPAVFMPTKTAQLYNPRAHSYFHPSGSTGRLRLTQPPSMFQLPPLPSNNRMSVINLFDIRRNFEDRGPTWTSALQQPPTNIASSQPVTVQSPTIMETLVSVDEEPTRSATF